jgi:hypothetical protein
MKHLACLITLAAFAVAAEKSKTPTAQDSNEIVEITATLYADKESVVKLLGRDPGFPLIVVDVKFRPRLENKIALWRDDFTLLSNKDGQRSQPLTPSQLAGSASLMVAGGGGYSPGSGMRTGSPADTPLGYPDITGTGRPRQLNTEDQLTSGSASETKVSDRTGGKLKENPLLEVLKARVLPEKEADDTVTGQLYFVLDGKHKPKDLELIYKSQGRRILLDFER